MEFQAQIAIIHQFYLMNYSGLCEARGVKRVVPRGRMIYADACSSYDSLGSNVQRTSLVVWAQGLAAGVATYVASGVRQQIVLEHLSIVSRNVARQFFFSFFYPFGSY